MKTKYFWLVLVAVLALAGAAVGRAAWRIHRQVVTLHVRNMPLAQVLRKIEWQTWNKIRVERGVDTRVTLNVDRKPLRQVLDRIAEQAGARWTTVNAVYGSKRALGSLETAMKNGGQWESAGWTRVAPKPVTLNFGGPGANDRPTVTVNGQEVKLPPGAVTATEDKVIRGSGGAGYVGKEGHWAAKGAAPMTVRVVRRGKDGAQTEQEVWTPVELLIPTALKSKLGEKEIENPMGQGAAEAARRVNGNWTTYLAFKKSPISVGFAGGGFKLPPAGFKGQFGGGGGTNQPGLQGEHSLSPIPMPDVEDMARRDQNAQFARLTPEQRVQRARDRLNLQKSEPTAH